MSPRNTATAELRVVPIYCCGHSVLEELLTATRKTPENGLQRKLNYIRGAMPCPKYTKHSFLEIRLTFRWFCVNETLHSENRVLLWYIGKCETSIVARATGEVRYICAERCVYTKLLDEIFPTPLDFGRVCPHFVEEPGAEVRPRGCAILPSYSRVIAIYGKRRHSYILTN